MVDMIRARLGKDVNYLEATGNKKQVAYVNVVEDRGSFQEGEWVDAEPKWYDAKFEGRWADAIRDNHQAGDTLLLFGTTQKVNQEADGSKH